MNANEVIISERWSRLLANYLVQFIKQRCQLWPAPMMCSPSHPDCSHSTGASALIPALQHLHDTFLAKGDEYAHVVKTGRTHLMDAMPLTFAQEFSGYARQIELSIARVEAALERLCERPKEELP